MTSTNVCPEAARRKETYSLLHPAHTPSLTTAPGLFSAPSAGGAGISKQVRFPITPKHYVQLQPRPHLSWCLWPAQKILAALSLPFPPLHRGGDGGRGGLYSSENHSRRRFFLQEEVGVRPPAEGESATHQLPVTPDHRGLIVLGREPSLRSSCPACGSALFSFAKYILSLPRPSLPPQARCRSPSKSRGPAC